MPNFNEQSLHPHEEALIRTFFVREQRARYLTRMANLKTRPKMVREFAHFYDLDPRFAHRIPSHLQTVDGIERLLKERGAPAVCHVMGETGLDGRDVPLREALQAVVDRPWGTFISCMPGTLVYFAGEDPNEHYILHRKSRLPPDQHASDAASTIRCGPSG